MFSFSSWSWSSFARKSCHNVHLLLRVITDLVKQTYLALLVVRETLGVEVLNDLFRCVVLLDLAVEVETDELKERDSAGVREATRDVR